MIKYNKECKAIFFDLFETLITEWGHEKYTKNKMCKDLGIVRNEFDPLWRKIEHDRYLGYISFEDAIKYVCEKCNKSIDDFTLNKIVEKRIKTKSECFEHIDPDIFKLLNYLKRIEMKTAIISNCSSEEVEVIKKSKLFDYFDVIVLSFECHMKKPDSCIYEQTAKKLDVDLGKSVFVGDGGNNELEGAFNVGMKAIQAKWYTNQLPTKRERINGFDVAEKPLDIIQYLNQLIL